MLLKDHADLGLLLRQMLAAAHAAGAGCSRPRYGFARFPHIVGARSSVTLHPGLNKDGTYRFTVRLLDSEFEPTRHCAPRPHCRCCTDPLGSCSCTLADDAKECARCAKETLAAAKKQYACVIEKPGNKSNILEQIDVLMESLAKAGDASKK